jgi:hypothetical protein
MCFVKAIMNTNMENILVGIASSKRVYPSEELNRCINFETIVGKCLSVAVYIIMDDEN